MSQEKRKGGGVLRARINNMTSLEETNFHSTHGCLQQFYPCDCISKFIKESANRQ